MQTESQEKESRCEGEYLKRLPIHPTCDRCDFYNSSANCCSLTDEEQLQELARDTFENEAEAEDFVCMITDIVLSDSLLEINNPKQYYCRLHSKLSEWTAYKTLDTKIEDEYMKQMTRVTAG